MSKMSNLEIAGAVTLHELEKKHDVTNPIEFESIFYNVCTEYEIKENKLIRLVLNYVIDEWLTLGELHYHDLLSSYKTAHRCWLEKREFVYLGVRFTSTLSVLEAIELEIVRRLNK